MGWKVKFEEKPETQYPPMNEREKVSPDEFAFPGRPNNVSIYVDKIVGFCVSAVEGDKWVCNPSFNPDDSKISYDNPLGIYLGQRAICSVAFKSLYPYVLGMQFGISAVDLGIAKTGEDGYVTCPAWGPPTCEAMVIFRLHPEPAEELFVDAGYEHMARIGHISVPSYIFERFATDETKENRRKLIEEWEKAGKPKFWDGWSRPTKEKLMERKS